MKEKERKERKWKTRKEIKKPVSAIDFSAPDGILITQCVKAIDISIYRCAVEGEVFYGESL